MLVSRIVCILLYLVCCLGVIWVFCEPENGDAEIRCDPKSRYPNFDGSCHNLKSPTYGMAGKTFRRILPPQYENNDGNTQRLTGVTGKPLPNPRKISTEIHTDEDHRAVRGTMMVMQWGHFLNHGLTFTPFHFPPNGTCCSEDKIGDDDQHDDVRSGGVCFPIIVPKNDRYYNASRCLEFTRSLPHRDSKNIRQQYSNMTSWIDASQIYGSSEATSQSLRSFEGGKLMVKVFNGQDFLPQGSSLKPCFRERAGDYCFKAGDIRSNIIPGLTALHTIFLRYHNQLCDRLKAVHPDWDDETLFQETRRVIIAIFQRITYDRYLAVILGPLAEKYQLLTGTYEYNETIDPTLANVFTAAAYRFGHSLVTDSLIVDGQSVSTGALIMRSKYVLNQMKGVLEGLMNERCGKTDRFYTKGITDHMFESPIGSGTGFDIVTINIQRGRDHGLPPYNVWREHFGLERKTFETLGPVGQKYRKVYDSVDDIDLYSAGINEDNVEGAMIGELYSKIIPQQFRDLKFGDRFWFENTNDVTSFSKDQIAEIKKITVSKMICDTVPDVTRIQLDVFLSTGPDNPVADCSTLEDIDITKF